MRLLKPFSTISIKSFKDVERFQNIIENVINGLSASPIVSGQLVTDLELSTTPKRIEHRLGRKPLGYIVVRQNANQTVFEQTEARKDLFLNLAASGPVTVSLWIF